MENVHITVIITTHNLEDYIDLCLEDLKTQTFQNFNILVLDDCSTDNTVELIEKHKVFWANRLDLLMMPKNLGMPALARNYALDSGKITGEYVLFLDGDDRIEPDMLEKLALLVKNENADVGICAYDRINELDGEKSRAEMTKFGRTVMDNPAVTGDIAFINTAPWNKLWRYDVIKNLRYPAFKVGEEVSFNYRGYMNSQRIAFTDEVLIHYNVRSSSVISNTDVETIWNFYNELLDLRNILVGDQRLVVEELVFFHIGLSMALRAACNCEIDLKSYLRDVRVNFANEFDFFKENKYLKLRYLLRHGGKGVFIWLAIQLYRYGLFYPVLELYRRLRIDIRF